MKMIIAVVQDKFVDGLIERLSKDGISITKLSSSGGFFKAGNTTLLLGVEEDMLTKVYSIFRHITRPEDVETNMGQFKISGANLFVIDVEESMRI